MPKRLTKPPDSSPSGLESVPVSLCSLSCDQGLLSETGGRISIDGRDRYLDNIFIKRLWRPLKQEAICFEEIDDGFPSPTRHQELDDVLQRKAVPFGA